MSDTITLQLPRDDSWTYPISHGDKMYLPYRADHVDPDSAWLVDVPIHTAEHFLKRGGFSLPQTFRVVGSAGSIPIRHPDPTCAGFSFEGLQYPPDENGVMWVPIEATQDAGFKSHGFVVADGMDVKVATEEEVVADGERRRRGRPPKVRESE